MKIPTPTLKCTHIGFSLPEVTMAVGIAAMAIVVLLGLVPAGMSSIREASNTLAESRIIQQIAAEIQGSDWGSGSGAAANFVQLNSYNGVRRFFDDQGTPLDSGGANSIRLSYVARVQINAAGLAAVPNGIPSNNLAAVQIDVASVPDPDFSFDGSAPFKTQTVLIARQY
jgi:uncharacterized protein (TIGR02598 family)